MKQRNINIDELISQMTLDEKIGQMILYNASLLGESKAEITGPLQSLGIDEEKLCYVGSITNFSGAAEMKKIQDKQMNRDRFHIPLLFMMDVIHGYRTLYPVPLGLGASFDPELLSECSKMAAKEASSGGVHVTFAPMVDYVRDARWGRVVESYSEDPYLNSVMGATQVRAFQGDDLRSYNNIAACVKHFAAYGGAEAGRDYNTVEISERILREYYLPAYKACIDAGVKMLMPSFNSLNGIPAIANPLLMKEILKDEWGFDGLIVSDYNALGELLTHGIAETQRESAALAFEYNCDIELMSSSYYSSLRTLIEDGTFPEEKLDAAVKRILSLKEELGLFEDPYHGASPEKENEVCLSSEHRALVRHAAEECAVLLKNDGILPFSVNTQKIAIIGPFAETQKLRGPWYCCAEDKDCISVKDGIQNLLPNAKITVAKGCSARWDSTDTSGFDAAIKTAKESDIVILCVGEPQNYSGEGNSRADIGFPGLQPQLIRKVLEVNANAATVVFSGRPLVLTELNELSPAILEMWFPGTEGGNAVANLLFGQANPSGKLPMSFPKAVGQCPIYYNHPSTGRPKVTPENVHQPYASNYIGCGNLPLFSFGYGLSYTHFTYENMTLDKNQMSQEDTITVQITVLNDGNRTGKETVQLYLHDLYASTVRPIQSLIAFEKIELAPGERKTLTFTITEPMLRFYDFDCKYISEPGDFTISVGYADHMIFTEKFHLN